jgi:hypothetical protein
MLVSAFGPRGEPQGPVCGKKGPIAFSRIGNGGRVAHISLVFREMWDSTDVNR